jgi:beta-1,3-galactosyltransferase
VDDDSFVRVPRLLERVAQMPREAAMLGYIESPGGGPHRDPDNQWHVTVEEWPTDSYPPWAHGAGAGNSMRKYDAFHQF